MTIGKGFQCDYCGRVEMTPHIGMLGDLLTGLPAGWWVLNGPTKNPAQFDDHLYIYDTLNCLVHATAQMINDEARPT